MLTNETKSQQIDRIETRYILITQCLQNDFFLNRESALKLPDKEVGKMLVGKNCQELGTLPGGGRVKLPDHFPANGPLGIFLNAVIGNRRTGNDGQGTLHLINIRDWHRAGRSYDQERSTYGAHCEAETWGARYIDGLEEFLDPANPKASSQYVEEGRFLSEGSLRIYHIHSDTIFDFMPQLESIKFREKRKGHKSCKFHQSVLENILDIILMGAAEQIDELTKMLQSEQIEKLEEQLIDLANYAKTQETDPHIRIYLAVIGVCTDIKIKTLLGSLRARYDLHNLAVSDTLTASPTMERHLEALDSAYKLMGVQVIHGLNNLIRFLGGKRTIDNELEIVAADRFLDYANYFRDKQNVLAYENEKLQEYLRLTHERSEKIYENIERSNKFLLAWGKVFLSITIILAVWGVIAPYLELKPLDWKLPALTGGLSLLQLVSNFFSRPMSDMQKNLTNLATFRMILESHSLKTALARFHLTTPQTLRENINIAESAEQIKAVREQFAVIKEIEEDYKVLKYLGFGSGEK